MSDKQNRSRTYVSWCMMRQRCEDPNHHAFKWYGGRGISVCERWKKYANFLADMGERPSDTQIDRIDPDGLYEPTNCRWATRKEQQNNTRRNVVLTAGGKSMTMTQWSDETGIKVQTIWRRLQLGWSQEKSVLTPLMR